MGTRPRESARVGSRFWFSFHLYAKLILRRAAFPEIPLGFLTRRGRTLPHSRVLTFCGLCSILREVPAGDEVLFQLLQPCPDGLRQQELLAQDGHAGGRDLRRVLLFPEVLLQIGPQLPHAVPDLSGWKRRRSPWRSPVI